MYVETERPVEQRDVQTTVDARAVWPKAAYRVPVDVGKGQ